jgi:hypothetical protein
MQGRKLSRNTTIDMYWLKSFSFIEWHLTIWSNWVTRGGGKRLSITQKKSTASFFLFDWYDVTVHIDKSHLQFPSDKYSNKESTITKWYKPTVSLLLLKVCRINQANSFDELPTVRDMCLSTYVQVEKFECSLIKIDR